MSEIERERYKKETGKKSSYFGNLTKEFYDWLNEMTEEDDFAKITFTSGIEKEYIKKTGKLPYQEGDNDISEDFKIWLKERSEKIQMEEGIQEVKEIKKTSQLNYWLKLEVKK